MLRPDELPRGESLKDVLARVIPYWYETIVQSLASGSRVLVVAHGNSLRALMKHLEGISDGAIAEVNLPTGVPRAYRLDFDHKRALEARYLGDADTIAAKAKAVAEQAKVQ
jgi:2,3-bisphosphoglycerate-dependent phosphoglycerate mutase